MLSLLVAVALTSNPQSSGQPGSLHMAVRPLPSTHLHSGGAAMHGHAHGERGGYGRVLGGYGYGYDEPEVPIRPPVDPWQQWLQDDTPPKDEQQSQPAQPEPPAEQTKAAPPAQPDPNAVTVGPEEPAVQVAPGTVNDAELPPKDQLVGWNKPKVLVVDPH